MTYDPQYPYQPIPAAPTPPPPRKRHRVRNTLIALAGLAVVGGIIGGTATSGSKDAGQPAATSPAAAPTTSAPASPAAVAPTTSEAPVPDPEGNVSATCDYELSSDLDNYEIHAGDLDVEADVNNTGNIGAVVHVAVAFPQLGHAPIVLSKDVRVPAGGTVTVPLTRPASQNEIERLQDWQSGHEGEDLCTTKGSITSTFGKAS
jgi:hypothetical protein